jgi:hypothetical protein
MDFQTPLLSHLNMFSPQKIQEYMAYTFDNGVLFYNSKVCIHNFEDFCVFILYVCHNNPIASHVEFQIKTYMAIKINHFWPNMKWDICEYVEKCYMC